MREARRHVGTKLLDGASWEDDASEFVRHVNQQKHSRLTLPRIADFLTRQVVAINGDWADAALLSGSGDANARLYYYSPSHDHLHKLWHDLWSGVAKGLRTELEMGSAKAYKGEGFCNPGCPTPEGVAAMVKGLVERCDKILRGRRSRERIRSLHNVLTVYTCLMVLWHTGIRAVTQPVELSLYDATTGFLGVSDKDTDVYYSSRIVWLPDVVQEQVAAYRQHLEGLRVQIGKRKDSSFKDELLLLDTNWKTVPVTGEGIREELPDYPYRLNSQRHYLRTMLRKLGVRAQIVDAILGHGAPGQEPYTIHSCLSPRRLQTEAGPALKKLSEMANWSVFSGLSP